MANDGADQISPKDGLKFLFCSAAHGTNKIGKGIKDKPKSRLSAGHDRRKEPMVERIGDEERMWWHRQNLDKPVINQVGERWHFLVWHGDTEGMYRQRIFFWKEDFSETGIVEIPESQALHIRRLRQRIAKLANDPEYRKRFLQPLQFPIERHYT